MDFSWLETNMKWNSIRLSLQILKNWRRLHKFAKNKDVYIDPMPPTGESDPTEKRSKIETTAEAGSQEVLSPS